MEEPTSVALIWLTKLVTALNTARRFGEELVPPAWRPKSLSRRLRHARKLFGRGLLELPNRETKPAGTPRETPPARETRHTQKTPSGLEPAIALSAQSATPTEQAAFHVRTAGRQDGEGRAETRTRNLRRIPDELIRRGNLDVVNALFDERYVLHDEEAGVELHGQEGYKEYVTNLRIALPDLLVTVHDQEIERDKVITRYSVHGTHAGWLRGARPTGNSVSFSGQLESRFVGDRVAEEWNSYDVRNIEQQLGVELGRRASV